MLGWLLLDGERRASYRDPKLWSAWIVPIVIWFLLRRAALEVVPMSSSDTLAARVSVAVAHLPALLVYYGKM